MRPGVPNLEFLFVSAGLNHRWEGQGSAIEEASTFGGSDDVETVQHSPGATVSECGAFSCIFTSPAVRQKDSGCGSGEPLIVQSFAPDIQSPIKVGSDDSRFSASGSSRQENNLFYLGHVPKIQDCVFEEIMHLQQDAL
jgi:hypothetical protein